MEELSAAKLHLDKFRFSSSGGTSQQCSLSTLDSLEIEQAMLSDKLTVLINDNQDRHEEFKVRQLQGKKFTRKTTGPGLPFRTNASHEFAGNFSNPDF